MSKRRWLLGLSVLVSIALLVACGSKYNSSSDGLVLVGSQGSNVIQSFSFNLSNGHAAGISNPPDTSGEPFSIVIDPAGAYAYVILDHAAVGAFKVNSGGTISAVGSPVALAQANVTIAGSATTEPVSVVPNAMAMDSAGKFLFVSNRATTDAAQRFVPGSVSVFSIGAGGSLTEVAGSPFFASSPASTIPQSRDDFVSLGVTPTAFPAIGINGVQSAVCSTPGNTPPTSEYLYAVDSVSNQVSEFQVDISSGVLSNPTSGPSNPSFPTGAVPQGVAVDPCDRFVYVSNSLSNQISAFSICTAVVTGQCSSADGSLVAVSLTSVSGSANGIGPIVVDPFGNNVYVLGTASNTVSGFKISPVTGILTPLSTATVATGSKPTSIAIRGDDNWLFVSNYGSASVSQYAITPATGALNAQAPIQTDNSPWGVAVK